VRLSRSPSTVTRPPPLRGQHSDEVLAEFGLTAAEIAALRGAAVI
jgi:crotonobetainyl-CoA:carnitine CoA-transferase CaiB-like acyl-CoA transferase